jgi:hypothetical protein
MRTRQSQIPQASQAPSAATAESSTKPRKVLVARKPASARKAVRFETFSATVKPSRLPMAQLLAVVDSFGK